MVPDVIYEECKKDSLHGSVRKRYEEMRGEKYYGTYTPVSAIPILHLRDLDLMQHVMGKKKVYLLCGWILLSYLKMKNSRSQGFQLLRGPDVQRLRPGSGDVVHGPDLEGADAGAEGGPVARGEGHLQPHLHLRQDEDDDALHDGHQRRDGGGVRTG